MKAIELTLVVAGAAALVVWRAIAMYQSTFTRKRL
jgi:hypothetical protein